MNELALSNNQLLQAEQIIANMNSKQLAALLFKNLSETDEKLEVYQQQTTEKLTDMNVNQIKIQDEIKNIHEKISYSIDPNYTTITGLGSAFMPPMRNKLALVLKWLGIVYYNTDIKRFIPFANKIGTFCKQTQKETKYGYAYTEYTYNIEKVIKALNKKLEHYGWYDEFHKHRSKEERDNWINIRIANQN